MIRNSLVILATSISLAIADELPQYYGINHPGCAEAFRIAESADFRSDLDTEGNFDIGIGITKNNTRYPTLFTHRQLKRFWETQAKNKFVCLTLNKNVLSNDEKNKYIRKITTDLFACGIARVRIHQGYGGGIGVLFDGTNPSPIRRVGYAMTFC